MRTEDFDYPLPKDLIAQKPLADRETSRLLVVDRRGEGEFQDRNFLNLLEYLPAGDVLVLNDTKVFPARLLGKKKKTEGKVEVLLLEPFAGKRGQRPFLETTKKGAVPICNPVWRCLIQPVLKEGQEFFLGDGTEALFLKRDADGTALVEFKEVQDVWGLAKKIGTAPLPPYIKREADASDEESYQTVYARNTGAVAAPTAGLHFTKELLEKIQHKGVEILYVTLHVGYGTFKPVEDLESHRMHAEAFELSQETADKINQARSEKRQIWAVGTTSLRVLEPCVQKRRLIPGRGQTDLFIKEGFEFEVTDHLLTNFHLPKTTLLLLVSAFMGEDLRRKAYEHAMREKYRFYSYGDAMLIV